MDNLPAPRPADIAPAIADLARRYRRAHGPLVSLMTRFAGRVESQLAAVPGPLRRQIEAVVAQALMQAHRVAGQGRRAPDVGRAGAPMLAALTGAVGGAGGLATAIPELPVTITVMLHAIRRAAEEQGFDPDDPAIRDECLRVFSAGSPMAGDDGVNTAFLGARLAMTGGAVQTVIRTVAPRLAAALGQKLIAQAVPVLGAVTGAALNAAFLSYYRELARIRFTLLRLAETHGPEATLTAFSRAIAPPPLTRAG